MICFSDKLIDMTGLLLYYRAFTYIIFLLPAELQRLEFSVGKNTICFQKAKKKKKKKKKKTGRKISVPESSTGVLSCLNKRIT